MSNRKEYMKRYHREWYLKNIERITVEGKDYVLRNREKIALYQKDYRSKNKDKIIAQHQDYSIKNKEKIAAQRKDYSFKNKEKKALYDKDYFSRNRCRMAKQMEDYRSKHKEELALNNQKWRLENKEEIAAKKKVYVKGKIKTDIQFRLGRLLRTRLYNAVKNIQKKGSAVRDLGCTILELKFYLEGQFQDGMTWDNWTIDGWHIDHKVPLTFFDLTDRVQFLQAVHYMNLQPMWWRENIKKGGASRFIHSNHSSHEDTPEM